MSKSPIVGHFEQPSVNESFMSMAIDIVTVPGAPSREGVRVNFYTNCPNPLTEKDILSLFGPCKEIVIRGREGHAILHDFSNEGVILPAIPRDTEGLNLHGGDSTSFGSGDQSESRA